MKLSIHQPHTLGTHEAEKRLSAGGDWEKSSFYEFPKRVFDLNTHTLNFEITIHGPFKNTTVAGKVVIGPELVTVETDDIPIFTPIVQAAQWWMGHKLAEALQQK